LPVSVVFVAFSAIGLLWLVSIGVLRLLNWANTKDSSGRLFWLVLIGILLLALVVLNSFAADPRSTVSQDEQHCEYRWNSAFSTRELMTVALSEARRPYSAIIQTTHGDIRFEAHSDNAPCAAYAFRYLAAKGFYTSRACPRVVYSDVIECYESDKGHLDAGGWYEAGNYAYKEVHGGSVAVAIAESGAATGRLVLVGPASSSGYYIEIGEITRGIDILGAVLDSGLDGLFSSKPNLIISVKAIIITMGDVATPTRRHTELAAPPTPAMR
jgi:peptidyl-prolyl cis-trans isomerase B (cyclophilin B)